MVIKINIFGRLLVPIIYIVLISIGVSGKAAILFKKFNMNRKHNVQVLTKAGPANHVPPTHSNPDHPVHPKNSSGRNTNRWNHYTCDYSGTITLLIVLFLIFVSNYIFVHQLTLTQEESAHLMGIFQQFIFCNGIPMIAYWKNDKLYKHVKSEICICS